MYFIGIVWKLLESLWKPFFGRQSEYLSDIFINIVLFYTFQNLDVIVYLTNFIC